MWRFFLWKKYLLLHSPYFCGKKMSLLCPLHFWEKSKKKIEKKKLLAKFFSAENPSSIKLIWCGLTLFYRLFICWGRAYPNLLSAPCSLSLTRLRSAPSRKVMLTFLLELPMQLHYIAKQGYFIFSRATKIFKLVALLATNDLPWIFTPAYHLVTLSDMYKIPR